MHRHQKRGHTLVIASETSVVWTQLHVNVTSGHKSLICLSLKGTFGIDNHLEVERAMADQGHRPVHKLQEIDRGSPVNVRGLWSP